jgi:hypothetical protein
MGVIPEHTTISYYRLYKSIHTALYIPTDQRQTAEDVNKILNRIDVASALTNSPFQLSPQHATDFAGTKLWFLGRPSKSVPRGRPPRDTAESHGQRS